MQYKKINHLTELIYEAAIDATKWYDLLNSLADFVDHVDKQSSNQESDTELNSLIPGIAALGDVAPNTTISEALKSMTDIDVDVENGYLNHVGEVNDMLISHFARAIKIAKRLVDMEEQHEVVLSLLDRLPIALVLVDEQARIVESNALADEILTAESGLSIDSGMLSAGINNQNKLQLAIEAMSKHDPATSSGKTLSLTSDTSSNNLMLFLAPVKHHGLEQQASVAVFISQRKSQPIRLPPELSEVYGLTEKEIEITGQLVRGYSVKEISEERSVSSHTVRSQVKSIFRKTETSRQAELVSLVYNGMGSFVNTIPEVMPGKRNGLLSKSVPWLQNYRSVQLHDGRNLAYQEYGDPEGEVVVHCHSVLGSRLERAFDADEVSQHKKARLIIVDRPGYGKSDPDSDMSFTKWAYDLEQLLDALDIEQCMLTGYAMGGRHALACAHEIPGRIKKISLISSGMPAESAEDFEQMMALYKMNTRLARYVPKVYNLLASVMVKGSLKDPVNFYQQMSTKVGEQDQSILNDENFRKEHFEAMEEGFIQGGHATPKEVIQLMHDWGFELSKIETPVDIWHGDSDYHVPMILSKRMLEYLPNAQIHIKPGYGHFMFYSVWAEVLDKLMQPVVAK